MFNSKSRRHAKSKIRERWLFYATDFQSLMYPCFTFCLLLGMFPYKINASTFEISKPRYIVSTVTICVYCVLCLLHFHATISGTMVFEEVAEILEDVSYYMFNSLLVISTHILSGPRMRLLQTILEISSKLSPESYQELSRVIHVKDISGIILVLVEGFIYYAQFYTLKTYDQNSTLLSLTMAIYMELVVFQMNMLYINCVCILKACFKKINDDLMQIQILINHMQSFTSSSICSKQKNQYILIKLKILIKQHLMISRTVQKLNMIFSLQLLATIIVSFCVITFEIYFFLVSWQGEILIDFNRYPFEMFLAAIAHYIVNIILIVWACETGKNQAQKISTTICDVRNSTTNKQIKAELQFFSWQMKHCKNTFSARGMTVDATLLKAMVGGITTYTLILVQFLAANHSCDEKSMNLTIS